MKSTKIIQEALAHPAGQVSCALRTNADSFLHLEAYLRSVYCQAKATQRHAGFKSLTTAKEENLRDRGLKSMLRGEIKTAIACLQIIEQIKDSDNHEPCSQSFLNHTDNTPGFPPWLSCKYSELLDEDKYVKSHPLFQALQSQLKRNNHEPH